MFRAEGAKAAMMVQLELAAEVVARCEWAHKSKNESILILPQQVPQGGTLQPALDGVLTAAFSEVA